MCHGAILSFNSDTCQALCGSHTLQCCLTFNLLVMA